MALLLHSFTHAWGSSTPPPPRQAWATQISPAKSEPVKRSEPLYRQPPALPSDDAANNKPPGWSPPPELAAFFAAGPRRQCFLF